MVTEHRDGEQIAELRDELGLDEPLDRRGRAAVLAEMMGGEVG